MSNQIEKIHTRHPRSSIKKIAVVGLGYVGLPLAVKLAKHYQVLGFDIKQSKVDELKQGLDKSGEVAEKELKLAPIFYSTNQKHIREADLVIICVPTPVDKNNRPDFSPLESASQITGKNLKRGAIVVYESTVYPGATEEVCLPILEKFSGLKSSRDFKIGYSPERINPGDKERTVDKIVKVVAGQDKETTEVLAEVYSKIITAGVHKATNIKTAEAAKVIENTQRDLNIALMNELSKIFSKMGLNTREVLAAAKTKWNFGNYYPGLVGGHCLEKNQLLFLKNSEGSKAEMIGDYVKKISASGGFRQEIVDEAIIFYPNKKIDALSFNVESRIIEFKPVNAFSKRKEGKIIKVNTDDGRVIQASPMHPMLICENDAFLVKHAKDLTTGDKVPFANCIVDNCFNNGSTQNAGRDSFGLVCVSSIEEIAGGEVYSLEVADNKTVVTSDGLIVHNCISVDPYYLASKAQELGYHPEVILAGRRINDTMHQFVVEKLVKQLNKAGKLPAKSKVLVLGLTFKENVPDPRNSRVKHLIAELQSLGCQVFACDPLLENGFVEKEFGVKNIPFAQAPKVDAIVLAVPHQPFKMLNFNLLAQKLNNPPILIDLRGMFNKEEAEKQGFLYDEL